MEMPLLFARIRIRICNFTLQPKDELLNEMSHLLEVLGCSVLCNSSRSSSDNRTQ